MYLTFINRFQRRFNTAGKTNQDHTKDVRKNYISHPEYELVFQIGGKCNNFFKSNYQMVYNEQGYMVYLIWFTLFIFPGMIFKLNIIDLCFPHDEEILM